MKILFLDMDGVVNSMEWMKKDSNGKHFPLGHICPEMVERLNRIVEATDCSIVISSSWRIIRKPEEIASYLEQKGFRHASRVIGKTGSNSKDARGGEIQDWLDQHPEVKNYVILDDDSMDIIGEYTTKKHPENFVHTCWGTGMGDKHVEQAIKILNKTLDAK